MSVLTSFLDNLFEKNPTTYFSTIQLRDRCLETGLVVTRQAIRAYLLRRYTSCYLYKHKSRNGDIFKLADKTAVIAGAGVLSDLPIRNFTPLRVLPSSKRLNAQPAGAIFERLPQSFTLSSIQGA